jgi:putative hydrolase of the HAD superfamily
MLRAIAFDLWETLITNTSDVSRLQKDLRLSRMAEVLSVAAEHVDDAHRGSWERCQELYWSEDRDIPCRRQVEHFLELLELDPASFEEETLAKLEHAYATAAVEILPKIVAGAPELLAELKSRGLRVGLISNTGRTPGYALREILARLGLADSIDVMVFSNEHGYCKPLPSIFEELRRGLDVAYDEMMFVGDNLYVDVHGAQRCGMRGVHFTPSVRGDAIAPAVDHGLEITPDAVVTTLLQVLRVIPSRGDGEESPDSGDSSLRSE